MNNPTGNPALEATAIKTAAIKTTLDQESQAFLHLLEDQERVKSNRITGVKTILIVLSARGMVYDVPALKRKAQFAYPGSEVFFQNTSGSAIGRVAPDHIDLLVDFTGPGQRQGWFYSKKLRKQARLAVGRNAGFFRKGDYDRIFDEKKEVARVPHDLLDKERFVQKEVLALAGIPLAQMGEPMADQGKTIGLGFQKRH